MHCQVLLRSPMTPNSKETQHSLNCWFIINKYAHHFQYLNLKHMRIAYCISQHNTQKLATVSHIAKSACICKFKQYHINFENMNAK